jgi:hypothetical protein
LGWGDKRQVFDRPDSGDIDPVKGEQFAVKRGMPGCISQEFPQFLLLHGFYLISRSK